MPCGALPPHGRFLSPCYGTHLGFGLGHGGLHVRRLPRLGILAKLSLVVDREKEKEKERTYGVGYASSTANCHMSKAYELSFFSFYTHRFSLFGVRDNSYV